MCGFVVVFFSNMTLEIVIKISVIIISVIIICVIIISVLNCDIFRSSPLKIPEAATTDPVPSSQ